MTESRQLVAIGHLHGLFAQLGVSYWPFGGWAVDFHSDRVTRDHADIDVAVWFSDLVRAKGALQQEGWGNRCRSARGWVPRTPPRVAAP